MVEDQVTQLPRTYAGDVTRGGSGSGSDVDEKNLGVTVNDSLAEYEEDVQHDKGEYSRKQH